MKVNLADKTRLRKIENRDNLKKLVRAKEAEVGEEKSEIFSRIFGRMATSIQIGTHERPEIFNPHFAGGHALGFFQVLSFEMIIISRVHRFHMKY